MSSRDPFTTAYADRTYRYPTLLRHQGTVIAFAMDTSRNIYYAALDLESTDSDGGDLPDAQRWSEAPAPLVFPEEIALAGYGAVEPIRMPMVPAGSRTEVASGMYLDPDERNLFLSTTARFTADAPFQVVSDGEYVYVFRQAITADHADQLFEADASGKLLKDLAGNSIPLAGGTLLVDRFALVSDRQAAKDGSDSSAQTFTLTLQGKLEVRYQRSRVKGRPQSAKDTLAAADLDDNPFYEPTQQLDVVRNLDQGRFTVLLLPTQAADQAKWQIFAYNKRLDQIDSINLAQSPDGLFDTRGGTLYTCPDHPSPARAQRGTCIQPALSGGTQVCGKTLVPMPAASGALAFDGAGGYVDLGVAPAALGIFSHDFTVEVWVKGSEFPAGATRGILGSAGPTFDDCGALHLCVRDGKPYFGFYGTGRDTAGSTVLPTNTWVHLAFRYTYATSEQAIFVNGQLDAANTGRSPFQGTSNLILGSVLGGFWFHGAVDEVRVWSRALDVSEIQAGADHRLSGLEPGLSAYYRLDEGVGALARDLCDGAHHGAIKPGVTWQSSDAPIGHTTGLRRAPLRITGRAVAGPPAAVLYHQQVLAPSGYSGQSKAGKQGARVLLAVPTSGPGQASDPAGSTRTYLAVIDAAVGIEGWLAEAPTDLPLGWLASSGGSVDLSAAIQAQSDLVGLTTQLATVLAVIAGKDQEIVAAAAQARANPVGYFAFILYNNFDEKVLFIRSSLNVPGFVWSAQDLALVQLDDQRTSLRAQIAAKLPLVNGLAALSQGDTQIPMSVLATDARGLTVAGGILGFAWTSDVPGLLDGGSGRPALYFRGVDDQLFVTYLDVVQRPDTPAVVGRWVASPPGMALVLDGSNYGSLAGGVGLENSKVDGDVTMEAWLLPAGMPATQAADVSWILRRHSNTASYLLCLCKKSLLSAMPFDGTTNEVTLPGADTLGLTDRSFTVEAWVNSGDFTSGVTRSILGTSELITSKGLHLCVRDGKPYMGFYSNDTGGVTQLPANLWVHLAFVYDKDKQTQSIYVNGVLDATGTAKPSFQGTGTVKIGGGFAGRYKGLLDEVRIFNYARSADQILADRFHRLGSVARGLAGYWTFEDGRALDRSLGGHHGVVVGTVAAAQGSPLASYALNAHVGGLAVMSNDAFAAGSWTHVAASYRQAYAVLFNNGRGHVECRDDSSLRLDGELTLEVALQVDTASSLAVAGGVLTMVDPRRATDAPLYALFIGKDGRVGFASGERDPSWSTQSIPYGRVCRVAVTRSGKTVTFYIDGTAAGTASCKRAGKGGSEHLQIGVAYLENPRRFRGTITELRVWSIVRDAADLFATLAGQESGLMAWWTFNEGEGRAIDAVRGIQATLKGGPTWTKHPDPLASELDLFVNGVPVAGLSRWVSPLPPFDQFQVGGDPGGPASQRYAGWIDELRVWRTCRTGEQVSDNMFGRIDDELPDLVAYYTFNERSGDGSLILDQSVRGNHLQVLLATGQTTALKASTSPIGDDPPELRSALAGIRTDWSALAQSGPSAAEYGVLERDASGAWIGVLKRCHTFISGGVWVLLSGYRVGSLDTEWVGQVQFDPHLAGYIEGAPPAPGENLALQANVANYAGATSVGLRHSSKVNHVYSSSRGESVDASIDLSLAAASASAAAYTGTALGPAVGAPGALALNLMVQLDKVTDFSMTKYFKTNFELSFGWLDEVSEGASILSNQASQLALQGYWDAAHGRYVPRNVGFALVKSRTADVYALRLHATGALVCYQMRPNPDIPEDWNIIHFQIDPHYTKQGSLDGRLGLANDDDYPAASTNGSDRSYYKPIEAYALKNQIAQQAQDQETAYQQFMVMRPDPTVSPESKLDDDLPKTKRDICNTYVWTADGGLFAETEEATTTRSESCGGSYSSKWMLGTNLVGATYVFGSGVAYNLTAMAGGHVDVQLKRGKDTEETFGLDVALGGVEKDIYLRQRDANNALVLDTAGSPKVALDAQGKPRREPGKVDAYRFMSFYLDATSDNHQTFYERVVDPIWLRSNDPGAVALRQARNDATAPACWRVLHRVTYVSRVLPPLSDSAPASLEKAMAALDLASNYELLAQLDPLVRPSATSLTELAAAVRLALVRYFPALSPYSDEIIQYLGRYYDLITTPTAALPAPAVRWVSASSPTTNSTSLMARRFSLA